MTSHGSGLHGHSVRRQNQLQNKPVKRRKKTSLIANESLWALAVVKPNGQIV
jgi:hypothetical protein